MGRRQNSLGCLFYDAFILFIIFVVIICGLAKLKRVFAQCPGGVCPAPGAAPFWRSPAQPTAPRPSPPPRSLTELPEPVRKSISAICMIDNRGFGGGSGVYLGNGLVITCDHLFRDDAGSIRRGRIVVTFPSGEASAATVLEQDQIWDLSILRLEHPPKLAGVALGERAPQVGQTLVACGFGGQGTIQAQMGRVVAFGQNKFKRGGETDTIILTGAARSGDSGGPIFDTNGRLAGVLWGTDGQTIVGSHVERCWRFGGRFLGGRSPAVPATPGEPPALADAMPVAPPVPPANDSLAEKLRDRLDSLEGKLKNHGLSIDGLESARAALREQLGKLATESIANRQIQGTLISDLDERVGTLSGKFGDRLQAIAADIATIGEEKAAGGSWLDWFLKWAGPTALTALGIGGGWKLMAARFGLRIVRKAIKGRPALDRSSLPAAVSEAAPMTNKPNPPPAPPPALAPGSFVPEAAPQTATRVIATDSPPPPQAVIPVTHVVQSISDQHAQAFAWAKGEYARKEPGAIGTLESLESLINQKLAAQSIGKPKLS